MKWYTKLVLWLVILAFVGVIGGMIYVVSAKYTMNDYDVQVAAVFNAAMLVNATETYTDPEHAVIAEYEGKSTVIAPENYRIVANYLSVNAAPPLFASVDRERALSIRVCGETDFYVVPDRNGDGATLCMEGKTQTFVMHVRGSELWEKLKGVCLEGTAKHPNLSL